ncbi:MAG: hypothetical protein U0105_25270 [Candidatus Obscuribacterales bacterium]
MTSGANDDDDNRNYLPGQPVMCRIEKEQPGGYVVTVLSPAPGEDDVGQVAKPGFLGTDRAHTPGDIIMGQFVSATRKQILLSEHAAAIAKSGAFKEVLDPALARLCGVQKYKLYTYKAIGNSSPVRLKRAVDLIPNATDPKDVIPVETGRHGPDVLIERLESERYTGVLRVNSEERMSRAAMLLFQGRVVGCHYACKELPYLVSTEGALQLALGDIGFTRTSATLYPLPEPVILSLAALFLGQLQDHEHDERAGAAMGTLCKDFAEQRATACIAITWPPTDDMCFVFIHEGQIHGSFRVDERAITADPEVVFELLKHNGEASLQASVLPKEVLGRLNTIGYALREAALKVD